MPRGQLNAFAPEWVPGGLAIPPAVPRAYASVLAPEPCPPPGLAGLKVTAGPEDAGAGGGASRAAVQVAGGADGDLEFDEVFAQSGGATPRTAAVPAESPAFSPAPQSAPGAGEQALAEAPATPPPLSTMVVESPCVDVPALQAAPEGTGSESGGEGGGEVASGKVGPADFVLLRVVGQGAFGKVFQVRKLDTQKVYAMKVMRKERILERDHGDYVRAERDVLTAVFHPYIVTLRFSFQTSSKLYLVLDFINGGHLFFNLYRAGIFDEELARLYTAEIVLAVAHLHKLGFIHRDLKPENVLLDSEGHIKVTDFGLAKGGMAEEERTNSFIGTMEYMAPEIVAGKGHGKAVDWWSVGILLYEMLCGTPPFRAKGRAQLQRQILTAKLKLPPFLSTAAQSLLRALLEREPAKRLGAGVQGSEAVMAHPFFRSLNWARLLRREMASPFRPSVNHVDSVENFDKIWTDQAAEDSPCGTPPAPDALSAAAAAFEGFSYCEPSFLAEMEAQSRLDTLLPSLTKQAPPPASEPVARLGVGAAVGSG